ncbi:lysosomal alpha-mannosidase-like [Leptopilina boulardi]|uniref:lysosomal alpha-mannosidase-like n=1 Tax=Leptopilina boulardi TaxID=63433 RepID=UPI0021F66F8A|nr:lysosomal alpha-mannosidase-like [Leptopilina boulardi]
MIKVIKIISISISVFLLQEVVFSTHFGKKKSRYWTSKSVFNNEKNHENCGYKSCAKVDPTKLNIHIVAHSHDDVGWLKTVDQYFFGKRNNIQNADVQKILTSSIKSLQKNPERRFIYVETSFLWMWWVRQNSKTKVVVQSLINEGRLEIIGGGWSMNDEAVTHYQSVIDQFTWGFRVLNDNFGKCARPKIGWQIDPFGHSREQASMFALMGFDGLLFGRLDYQDKNKRMETQTMEMIWKGSPSLGASSNLFTSILYNLYGPPSGFCFDSLCSDQPLNDDPESPHNNIKRRVKEFLTFVNRQNESYRTNNVIITMGNDFNYQEAESWFSNLDILIKNINYLYGSKYNAIYSTPSCYLKAVNDAQLFWSTKTDDFFPYASDTQSYWTGYYTSRPTIKFYERMGNNFLQVVKQLLVLNNEPNKKELNRFRRAMGILQHHDAITGTERQHVADDYSRILSISMREGNKLMANTLRNMMQKDINSEDTLEFHSCLQLNISSCKYTENNKKFVVTLYNPTSQEISIYVRIPVTGTSYRVLDYLGTKLVTQIVPVPLEVLNIPGRKSFAEYELIFFAQRIPALGYQSFYISEKTQGSEIQFNKSYTSISSNTWDIYVNSNGKVVVQSKTNRLLKMLQSFHFYKDKKQNSMNSQIKSGAYVFRPKTNALNIRYEGYYKIFKGPLVEEIHLAVNDYISEVIRIYNGQDRIEFNWLVGPLNTQYDQEIIMKYKTTIKSKNKFYTDSNGRDMLKRKKNKRKTWNFHKPIARNYYPVTTKIFLQDRKKKLRLTILTDRSQGGTSLKSGEIDLMIHRRLSNDDGFGVGEALNETAFGTGLVVRGEHSLLFGHPSSEFKLNEKNEAIRMAHRPWIIISPVENISYENWKNTYKMLSSGLAETLPPNVQILTLEPWKSGTVLLRLEHIFELKECKKYSDPVDVNIKKLFAAFIVTSVGETTLGGNQWLNKNNRLIWNSNENDNLENNQFFEPLNFTSSDEIIVQLKPMQIRTFIVKLEKN